MTINKIDSKTFKNKTKNIIINRKSDEDWLKSVENGKIGEARTKTFFINNGYWVLERSVDVNGADFIIQKRDLVNDLIDIEASPVVFVQSKFTSNEENEMTVDSKYIYYIDDNDLKTKNEFFLLIHFDNKDKNNMLFLSSMDIDELVTKNHLKLNEHKNKKGVFKTEVVFTLKQLFLHFQTVTLKDEILKKIDSAISSANYFREIGNRRFLGLSPQAEIIKEMVSKSYNNGDEIATSFYKTKKEVYKLIKNSTEYVYTLKDILTIDDPEFFIEEFKLNIPILENAKNNICSEEFNSLKLLIESLINEINESQIIVDTDDFSSPPQEEHKNLKYFLDNFEELKEISTKELKKLKNLVKKDYKDLNVSIFIDGDYYYPSELITLIDEVLKER